MVSTNFYLNYHLYIFSILEHKAWIDGTEEFTLGSAGGESTFASNWTIGCRCNGNLLGGFTQFAKIKIARLLFFSRLSGADRQRLEGKLLHDTGLAANLPTNHPYKNQPPTI